MEEFIKLIRDVGFPIASAVGCAYGVFYLGKSLLDAHRETLKTNTEEMKTQTEILRDMKDNLKSVCKAECNNYTPKPFHRP